MARKSEQTFIPKARTWHADTYLDGAEEAKMGTLMLSSKTARIITLVLRVLTLVILVTSFVLLATITQEVYKLNIHREVQGTWTMRFCNMVP